LIFIVSGPGGVGKGTVVSRLVQMRPDVHLSRSWTSRPRRAGEPGNAYVFVSREQFMAQVEAGGFLEWTEFPGTGHLYGTPLLEGGAGDAVVLEIDLDGARQVKLLHPDSVLILISVASPEVQKERLRRRGDDEASVSRRMEVGAKELEEGLRLADHVVLNDEVDRAAAEVAGIIDARRGGA